MNQVAQEALSALRTVQAYNALQPEQAKFNERVNTVLGLARKEAIASGIFFGSTGWSGNVTLLALLAFGMTWSQSLLRCPILTETRWHLGQQRHDFGR